MHAVCCGKYVHNHTPFIYSVCFYDYVLFRPEDDDFDIEEELQKLRPAPRPTQQPELEPRSRRGLVEDPQVTVIPEDAGHGNSDNEDEDSDSDGPIHYRDDDEEDDDDDENVPMSMILLYSLTSCMRVIYLMSCTNMCIKNSTLLLPQVAF